MKALLFAVGLTLAQSHLTQLSAQDTAVANLAFFPFTASGAYSFTLVAGSDHSLWFLGSSKIGKISRTGAVTIYPQLSPDSGAIDLVDGHDRSLWFIELNRDKIAHVTANGLVTEYTVEGILRYSLANLAAAADGSVWFTARLGNSPAIGHISRLGKVRLYGIRRLNNASPTGLLVERDGSIWFGQTSSTQVGRLSVTGHLSEFAMNDWTTYWHEPLAIADPNDGLWFLEVNARKIGRLSSEGVLTEYAWPIGILASIAVGPDRAIWFSYNVAPRRAGIGKISSDGAIHQVATEDGSIGPLVSGGQSFLCFLHSNGYTNAIARVSASGRLTEYRLPDAAIPKGLIGGPDARIWFVDARTKSIVRLNN